MAVIQEAYVHGVSTRAVDDLVRAMGGNGVSKSQVSRLCAEIDGRVQAFLARPIEGRWPYLWHDATYLKVRENGRIVSRAVIVAVGVNLDGRREVLGIATGPSEAFRGLRGRTAATVPFTVLDEDRLAAMSAHEWLRFAAAARNAAASKNRLVNGSTRPDSEPETDRRRCGLIQA